MNETTESTIQNIPLTAKSVAQLRATMDLPDGEVAMIVVVPEMNLIFAASGIAFTCFFAGDYSLSPEIIEPKGRAFDWTVDPKLLPGQWLLSKKN